jgi:fumarate reductase flavoprotein subunit
MSFRSIGRAVGVCCIIVLVLGLAGCGEGDQIAKEYDVIVVGSGLAGHGAVFNAVRNDATVLWIEKNDTLGGTAQWATGTFSAAGTELQEQKGIEDSPEQHVADINRIGKGEADQDLLRLFAEKAADVWELLVEIGLEPNPDGPVIDPVHSPYSVARTMTPQENSAMEFNATMKKVIDDHKKQVTTLLSTEVTGLVTEEDAVAGVTAVTDGEETEYRGEAVVLATGGYGSNHEMIRSYSPKFAEIRTVTPPHATGDGIRMAEELGANLVHMDFMVPYFGGIPESPDDYRVGFSDLTSGFAERWKGDIWVGPDGTRFVNEDDPDEDVRETALLDVEDTRVVIIFDQGVVEANDGVVPVRGFEERLENGYAVKSAGSLEELAAAFDLPADNLKQTVEVINQAAESGEPEPQFGKETNFELGNPPYYGILCYGVTFMTQGGVDTNTRMEVLDAEGSVIPGLYAAGEVQGTAQWSGHGYAGGAGNAPAIIFGMEAGKNAAAYAMQ